MEDEVRRAIAIGLDGFLVDLLSTSGCNAERVVRLMEAAAKVDPGFVIGLMPDMEALSPDSVAVLVLQLGKLPAAFHLADGRLVVAPFNAHNESPDTSWKTYAASFAAVSFGMSDWGRADAKGGDYFLDAPRAMHDQQKLWMMPVRPQDERPRDYVYWEAQNTEAFRHMWHATIAGDADWVQLTTWNDYSENSHVAPSVGTHHVFYDLTAYDTTWFKTGQAPAIVRDVLYYTHRNQLSTATPTQQLKPWTNKGMPAHDEIEVVALLTAPATIEVTSAEKKTFEAPAGLSTHRVKLGPGAPTMRVMRGATDALITSEIPVVDAVAYQDLLYRGASVTLRASCPSP